MYVQPVDWKTMCEKYFQHSFICKHPTPVNSDSSPSNIPRAPLQPPAQRLTTSWNHELHSFDEVPSCGSIPPHFWPFAWDNHLSCLHAFFKTNRSSKALSAPPVSASATCKSACPQGRQYRSIVTRLSGWWNQIRFFSAWTSLHACGNDRYRSYFILHGQRGKSYQSEPEPAFQDFEFASMVSWPKARCGWPSVVERKRTWR